MGPSRVSSRLGSVAPTSRRTFDVERSAHRRIGASALPLSRPGEIFGLVVFGVAFVECPKGNVHFRG